MNKKRLFTILTCLMMLLLLCGCSSKEEGMISLTTTFKEMMDESFFTAILTYPLAQAINFLGQHMNIGLAIAVVTIVLNAVIFGLTFKSNLATQRMQLLQPELTKIQEKYADKTDRTSQMRMSQEIQALYAKYDVNPIGTLLVTFIQLPVLLSMYTAVRRSEAVANGVFFGATLAMTPKEAIGAHEWILVLIYVLMIVTQFFSVSVPTWLAQRKVKRDCEAHHKHYEKPQNGNALTMYSIVILLGVVMLSWPTALSLYYCIYSIVNIAKTFLTDCLTNRD